VAASGQRLGLCFGFVSPMPSLRVGIGASGVELEIVAAVGESSAAFSSRRVWRPRNLAGAN
jgi:hypothetical protein